MLRAKKNAILKTSPLITFLKNLQIDPELSYIDKTDKIKHYIRYFDSYYKDLLKINVIKHFVLKIDNESIPYSIIKDKITETWFLTCNDLVILYIERTEIDQFKMDFLFSEIYKFVIYYDMYRDCYVAFCLSHTKSQILDILPKLYINNKHHHKYFILSHFLQSPDNDNDNDTDTNIFIEQSIGFVILNKNVYKSYSTNSKSNLIYYDDIGFGTKMKIISDLIGVILNITATYKYLPINYINL